MTRNDKQQNNIAFVDGQNLYMSTTTADEPWPDEIQEAGFILKLKEHNPAMLGVKKGNKEKGSLGN